MSRLTVVMLVAVAALAGVAIAAGGSGPKPVTLCVQKGSAKVSLAVRGKCAKREKKIVVAKKGPRGAKGKPGSRGADGPAGKPLDLTQEVAHQVAASTGDCAANPGTFCGTPAATGTWETILGIMTYRKDAAGWVHLTGGVSALENGTGTQFDGSHGAIFFLPPGYRPTDGIHRFYTSWSSCHNPGTVSYVDVLPNGAVKPRDNIGCLGLTKVVFRP